MHHSSNNHEPNTSCELLTQPPGSPALAPNTKSSKNWMYRVLDSGSYEAMAMAFSLGCLVAIIFILTTYNNNTIPQYFPGITLNAIISTLGTASKYALLYVIAECIGQLKWIWFYKGKKKKPLGAMQHKGQTLVSLGATITVLTLIFDPFMQQVLNYPIRE
ncbi:hypothetical protein BJX65DRAFT_306083 [Aspergillus insuetus]